MMLIPANPGDKGYFDMTNFVMWSTVFLNSKLTIRFKSIEDNKEAFEIHLDNLISFNCDFNISKFYFLRVDNDGSSYGLDIAIRLKEPKYKDFMVLYLFEDENHTKLGFRGLAEHISVVHI